MKVKRHLTEVQKAIAKAKRTALEDQFLDSIRALGLPEPEREVRFDYTQRRVDFAWPSQEGDYQGPAGVAVEIMGGTWSGGRHTRGKGYEDDCRKGNAAGLRGWTVLRFTGDMVKSLEAAQTVKEALGK